MKRRPDSWRALVPWVLLLLGCATAVFVAFAIPPGPVRIALPEALLERLAPDGLGSSRDIVLERPAALWLVPIAVLPFLVATLRRTLVDAPRIQIGLQLGARLLLLEAMALALAEPGLRVPIRGKTVVFVVDTSDSIDDAQLAAARDLVREATSIRDEEGERNVAAEDRTRLALVTYAGRATVQSIPTPLPEDAGIARPDRERLASQHGHALRLAVALVDPETEGRVVLVTDGGGTLAERDDLGQAVHALERRGVSVTVRSFPAEVSEDVLVRALHLPDAMRIGETFDIAVDLLSTRATTATLHFEQNGEPNVLRPELEVELREGPQQITFPARVTEPGIVRFEARLAPASLDPALNRRSENDSAAVVGEVRGQPKILLVGTGGDEPLAHALRADHLDVEIARGPAIPQDDAALAAYDLVIFSDLPASAVPLQARETVRRFVVDHGGGFMMLGGEHAFGLGGWGETTLEPILPVRFEGERQREQPVLALVLVIDKSGSMSSDDKLDLVKEAARATARTLEPSDQIGVVAFDSRPITLVRLQPAGNRIRIASDIRRLSAGGGTHALPALREAYLQLAGSNALIKHVILLSDGQSPENGIAALLEDMRDADITVSAIGVGAGAGKDLLRRISNRGRGRFYYSHDGTDVPRIFSRETQEVTRNAAKEQLFFPRLAKNAQALRGIDLGGAPGLRGIIGIEPKPLSEVLLRTHSGEPLLVRGRRGLGRTAAFASDAKARWAASWLTWGGFAKLWSQVARDTMRQGASAVGGASIEIVPSVREGEYRIVVDVESPDGFANDLRGRVEVLDPARPETASPEGLSLSLTAPGRYEAVLREVHDGQRLVRARLYDAEQEPPRLVAEATSQISVPYPTELLPPSMQGGALTLQPWNVDDRASIDEVLRSAGDADGRERKHPLWPLVVAFLVLPMAVIDLLLRRVSLGTRRLPG